MINRRICTRLRRVPSAVPILSHISATAEGAGLRLLTNQAISTLWTNSYFVSTVGGAPLAVVKQYIENQKRV